MEPGVPALPLLTLSRFHTLILHCMGLCRSGCLQAFLPGQVAARGFTYLPRIKNFSITPETHERAIWETGAMLRGIGELPWQCD